MSDQVKLVALGIGHQDHDARGLRVPFTQAVTTETRHGVHERRRVLRSPGRGADKPCPAWAREQVAIEHPASIAQAPSRDQSGSGTRNGASSREDQNRHGARSVPEPGQADTDLSVLMSERIHPINLAHRCLGSVTDAADAAQETPHARSNAAVQCAPWEGGDRT